MNIIMERYKLIEYIQTPLSAIPIQIKVNELMGYCILNGKNAGVSSQFLAIAMQMSLLDQLFLDMLDTYKKQHHIQIWHRDGYILKIL